MLVSSFNTQNPIQTPRFKSMKGANAAKKKLGMFFPNIAKYR